MKHDTLLQNEGEGSGEGGNSRREKKINWSKRRRKRSRKERVIRKRNQIGGGVNRKGRRKLRRGVWQGRRVGRRGKVGR